MVNAIAGFGLWCGSLYFKSSYPTNLHLLAAGTCCQAYTFAALCTAAARNGLGPEVLHAASLAAAAVASCAVNVAGSAEPCPLRAIGAALLGIVTLSLAPPAADLAGTLPAAAAASAAAMSLVVSTWVRWRRRPHSPFPHHCLETCTRSLSTKPVRDRPPPSSIHPSAQRERLRARRSSVVGGPTGGWS